MEAWNAAPTTLKMFAIPVASICAILLAMKLMGGMGSAQSWAEFRSGGLGIVIGLIVIGTAVAVVTVFARSAGLSA